MKSTSRVHGQSSSQIIRFITIPNILCESFQLSGQVRLVENGACHWWDEEPIKAFSGLLWTYSVVLLVIQILWLKARFDFQDQKWCSIMLSLYWLKSLHACALLACWASNAFILMAILVLSLASLIVPQCEPLFCLWAIGSFFRWQNLMLMWKGTHAIHWQSSWLEYLLKIVGWIEEATFPIQSKRFII